MIDEWVVWVVLVLTIITIIGTIIYTYLFGFIVMGCAFILLVGNIIKNYCEEYCED